MCRRGGRIEVRGDSGIGMGRGEEDLLECERVENKDEIVISGILTENRNFLNVIFGGEQYRVLLDTGTVLSIVEPKIAERMRARSSRTIR